MQTSSVIKIINRFSMLHREEIRKIMIKEDLHFGQHPILWALHTHKASTQIELAHHLGVSAASINNSVRRLANAGFLIKETDEVDQRKSRIFLTEKGQQAAMHCRVAFAELDQKLFQGMSNHEMEELYALFERMIKNLEQIEQE